MPLMISARLKTRSQVFISICDYTWQDSAPDTGLNSRQQSTRRSILNTDAVMQR